MFRFLASLFASDDAPAGRTPDTAFRPQLLAAEDRYTPSSVVPVNPLLARGFNPQPEPPAQVRGLIVEGGQPVIRGIFPIEPWRAG